MKENARVNMEMDYTVGSQQQHQQQQQQQQQVTNCELKSKQPFLSASSRTSAQNGSQHQIQPGQDWGAQVQQFQRYLQWQKYQVV